MGWVLAVITHTRPPPWEGWQVGWGGVAMGVAEQVGVGVGWGRRVVWGRYVTQKNCPGRQAGTMGWVNMGMVVWQNHACPPNTRKNTLGTYRQQ